MWLHVCNDCDCCALHAVTKQIDDGLAQVGGIVPCTFVPCYLQDVPFFVPILLGVILYLVYCTLIYMGT